MEELLQLSITTALETLEQPMFWRKFSNNLHINEVSSDCSLVEVTDDTSYMYVNYVKAIEIDGYFTCTPQWPSSAEHLRKAIEELSNAGFPPSFIVMYDETWKFVERVQKLMHESTGNYACNMDILAWLIDPNKGKSGFSPHRDRQPANVATSFRSDGSPRYSTCWVALSDATPANSCLYVIPKWADPGYTSGDFPAAETQRAHKLEIDTENNKGRRNEKKKKKKENITIDDPSLGDPLRAAMIDKFSYQHIRALPLQQGGAVIFTHRILHWGSKGGTTAYVTNIPSRISLSMAYSDGEYEEAVLLHRILTVATT